MDLAYLPAVILDLAQQRSCEAVLANLMRIVANQPAVALARIWLKGNDAACPVCRELGDPSSEICLHLYASAGAPQARVSVEIGEQPNWSRVNGKFHRIPLDGRLKIAHIATTGTSIRIPNLAEDRQWVREPEWVRAEGLVGFCGHPLMFRGEPLGVLAVFRRVPPDDAFWSWLRVIADAAAVAIANARAFEEIDALRSQLELERDYLREEVEEAGSFGEILGKSPALQRVLRQVALVASTDANVLIQGESGSGKELIARAIHQGSPRARKALVKVNCGSIPRELFESEFFGHVRGAFTGAVRDRVGRFQLADGGTLFLDEVGEIPLELQAKLLRVLQEGEFERVGEDTTRRVHVRVVAATNRDLRGDIAAGKFRLDLFYRLSVFPVELPPLRERRDDIPTLAAHFIRQACQRFHLPEPKLAQREVDRAVAYDWPGNVRELQNVVERAVILSRGGPLVLDLPDGATISAPREMTPAAAPTVIPEAEWRERERANLQAALAAARGKVSGPGGAAELLGLHPATLASRMKALGIPKRLLR